MMIDLGIFHVRWKGPRMARRLSGEGGGEDERSLVRAAEVVVPTVVEKPRSCTDQDI